MTPRLPSRSSQRGFVRGRIIVVLLFSGSLVGITVAAFGGGGPEVGQRSGAPVLPFLRTPEPTPNDPPWIVRVPRPSIAPGPRRIGIQAGHWKTDEVPDELELLRELGGGDFGDVTEWEYALDIARRVAARLETRGYAVDVLPATVPQGYSADAFIALHADGDVTGTARGFKIAHAVRRGPYEDTLVRILSEEYERLTRLPYDPNETDDIWEYYALRWERFRHSVAPHAPAAVIEMGFLTNAADRAVLLRQRDLVAQAIVNGIQRFLAEVPRTSVFGADIVVSKGWPLRLP